MIAVNERQAKMVDAQKLIDYINETGNLGVDATSISMHFGIWRNDAVVLLDSLIAEGRLTKKGSKPILYFLPLFRFCEFIEYRRGHGPFFKYDRI